jgi:cytochrome bd-type quinol oxidase subunit 1
MTDIQAAALLEAQLKLYRVQARWEPYKAMAAILGAAAIMAGSVLALSTWIGRQPQTIYVHLDTPIVVQPK